MKSQLYSLIEGLNLIQRDEELMARIEKVIDEIVKALSNNLPILVFGNGGSASDALHISAELVGKFKINRKSQNVLCLNSNVSVMTAWANDFEFESIYSRQVEAHSVAGGVCWGISTSGNSKSVVNALIKAKELGMITVGFTGDSGGKVRQFSDLLVNVPSKETPRIQELHLPIYHYICEKVEEKISQLI